VPTYLWALMLTIFRLNSIRSRMLLGFLFLTLLIVGVALGSLFFLDRTNRIAGIHSQISQLEIATLCLTKVDNDFFDLEAINSSYFETHESGFIRKRDSLKARIKLGSSRIYSESKNGVIDSLSKIDTLFHRYDEKFLQLEKLIFKKGFKDYGLEGQMRFHAHKLEENEFGTDMLSLLTLRRNEKDFFLRHDLTYAKSLNQLAANLLNGLRSDPVRNRQAIFHLTEYQRFFNELVDIQVQIGLGSYAGLRSELNVLSNQLTERYVALANYSYDASNAAQIRARFFYTGIVLGAILFSLFSGYWISKRLSEPIAQLSRTIESAISKKEDLKFDISAARAAEEIEVLTRSFVHLVSQQKEQMKEIRTKGRLLKRKNKILKKLNQELDSFVYSTAHDLRSPLSSLLGLLNILKFENKQEDLSPYFQMMQESIHRMEDFIAQIVGYSKNKRLEVTIEKIDLYSLIGDTFDSHRFVEGASRIDRFIKVNDQVPFYSDRGRLTIVLNNLISNAIRYADLSKPHPFIKIDVTIDEQFAMIDFVDNGIGIGEEHVTRVFDMFYRANVGSKGSGLGLFIFKETVAKLKGWVSLNSTLGEGTTYRIQLPNEVKNVAIQSELSFFSN
jgi:signal transduction histidine kinase